MSTSDNFAVFDNFVAYFAESVPYQRDRPNARFGHIKLPPYRFPDMGYMERTARVLEKHESDSMLLFVTSNHEKEMSPSLDTSVPSAILTFAEFMECLRSNHRPGVTGRRAWKPGGLDQTEAWENRRILPLDVMVVIHIDPSLPADCALSLLGVVQWALDMSVRPCSEIRVLTMSTADHHNLISQLVHLRAPDFAVPSIDLASETKFPDYTRISDAHDDDNIIHHICSHIEENPTTSQIIISFGDISFNDELEHAIRTVRPRSTGVVTLRSDGGMHMEALTKVSSPPTECCTILLEVSGDFPILPPNFLNYGQVHVILDGRLFFPPGWHRKSHQLVRLSRPASNRERHTQLWWADQPSGERYIYSRELNIDAFLQGYDHHYQKIDDVHLSGFIAAVYDLEAWGINVPQVLNCFLKYPIFPHRVDQITKRLETQRILSKDGFALLGSEAKAFRAVLPLVKYDHRLALLVAIESDPIVRSVKLQLAAMLTQGFSVLVDVAVDDLAQCMLQDNDLYQKLFESCWGYGQGFARQGDMWLILGLWKRHCVLRDQGGDNQLSSFLKGVISIDENEANGVVTRLRGLQSAMRDLGIAFGQEDFAHESEDLDENGQFEIQCHLFRAYMHQLTSTRYTEEFALTHYLVSSVNAVDLIHSPSSLTSVIDVPALLEQDEGTCLFGISHELVKADGKKEVMCMDWTGIPACVVDRWMASNAPESDLFSELTSDIRRLEAVKND